MSVTFKILDNPCFLAFLKGEFKHSPNANGPPHIIYGAGRLIRINGDLWEKLIRRSKSLQIYPLGCLLTGIRGLLCNRVEIFRISHRDVSQNFTIQLQTGQFQTMHKL